MDLVTRKSGLKVWVYRWFEPGHDGRPHRIKKVLGSVQKFPKESHAWDEVDRLGLGRTFDQFGPKNMRELIAHYKQTELTEDDDPEGLAFSTKDCNRNYLRNWIEPRWGSLPLSEVKAVDVEKWLKGLERTIVRGEETLQETLGARFAQEDSGCDARSLRARHPLRMD